MKKQIITEGEDKEFLMKAFKCSRMQVWKALHFQSQSDMARRIRTLAIKRGGALVGDFIPECETTFEEVEETMTQRWGNRVKLVYNRKNDEVKVYVDESLKRIEKPKGIPEFMNLQQEVEQMAQAL
ncbi:MAG: hypothetical protein WCS17_00175 [Prevotella sp.]|jgi:hypothetical protein|nr:hypothetical protein [Prevotella sp.]MCH3995037.1 hypothetical protein [Prevotella sp.]